jgi:hypothetical protein
MIAPRHHIITSLPRNEPRTKRGLLGNPQKDRIVGPDKAPHDFAISGIVYNRFRARKKADHSRGTRVRTNNRAVFVDIDVNQDGASNTGGAELRGVKPDELSDHRRPIQEDRFLNIPT